MEIDHARATALASSFQRPAQLADTTCSANQVSGRWVVGQIIHQQRPFAVRRTLRQFVDSLAGQKDQPAVKAALDAWFDEVSKADWKSSADVKRLYATASIVSAERIVFNIKGNDYRLVVAVDFEKAIVWIKWIGTHKAYDGIDVTEVRHGD